MAFLLITTKSSVLALLPLFFLASLSLLLVLLLLLASVQACRLLLACCVDELEAPTVLVLEMCVNANVTVLPQGKSLDIDSHSRVHVCMFRVLFSLIMSS